MNLSPVIKGREFDDDGEPLSGGKLYTYASGTTTPQATYTDSAGGTPNANPIVLDSAGRYTMWLNPALSYKFVLKTSADVTIYTVDNVIGLLTNDSVATASIQDLAVTTAKLANDSVTADKLADDASTDGNRAVTTNHIRDSAVTNAKLAGSITYDKMAAGQLGYRTVSAQTSGFTASLAVDVYVLSGTSFTVTLPAAASSSGKTFTFKHNDGTLGRTYTLDGNSAETIDGSATYALTTQHEAVTILCNGTTWYII